MRVTSGAPATTGPLEPVSARPEPATQRDTRRDARPWLHLTGAFLAAYVILGAVCVGLGLLVTHAGVASGLRHWDVSVNRWFVHQRTDTVNRLTGVGSHLAETPTVVGIGLLVVALVWWRRHDLYAVGILVVGLTLEVTVFVTTTLFVDRARPPVHHLDAAPPTSSFPSGHTAAAVVLYVGLIIVVHRAWHRNAATIAVAVLLALVPFAVGLSRLSRGMHHPTDVFVGAALGIAALTFACIAVRAAMLRAGRPDPVARSRNAHA
jgi:membrane-associated phospholipid phosphatase